MAQTLGEKLREAREAKGISLSEVAEQTRISPYYIEAIERDDYKPLPGGIFNKGFVKSFAKYVGINENDALAAYLSQLSTEAPPEPEQRNTYRPEVLTDEASNRSSLPTVLIAVLILGAMTAIVLYGLNYFSNSPNTIANNSNVNRSLPAAANTAPAETPAPAAPDLASSKIEVTISTQPVSLTSTSDGTTANSTLAPGSVTVFEPKESLKLSYSVSRANFVALSINGKPITLPTEPLAARRNIIEFEINKANFEKVVTSSSIVTDTPAASQQSNRAAPAAASNTASPKTSPTTTAANTSRSPNARPTASPAATRRTVVVGNATRPN